jgi:hypothetical protein
MGRLRQHRLILIVNTNQITLLIVKVFQTRMACTHSDLGGSLDPERGPEATKLTKKYNTLSTVCIQLLVSCKYTFVPARVPDP